jgi:uncharacterized protein (TIGR00369 family)
MKKLNPAYVEIVTERVNQCPYFSLIAMSLEDVGIGECRLEVRVQERHLQPFGIVHGGVFSSLVDAAAFWAVYPELDEHLGLTTVEMKLNYLAPASQGFMIAKGRRLRVGNTLCLGEASVENEKGLLLAHGTATMMILKDLKIQGQHELPQKFVL